MRGLGFVLLEVKVYDFCVIILFVDVEEFEFLVVVRVYKLCDGLEMIEKFQLFRDDGLGLLICIFNLNKNNLLVKVVVKEKSFLYLFERLLEKNVGNKLKEIYLLMKVIENFDFKNECKVVEMEKDVDLYYLIFVLVV